MHLLNTYMYTYTVLKQTHVDGKKILRWQVKDIEGTRQIDSVTSGEGVPINFIFRGGSKEEGTTVYQKHRTM